MGNLSGRVSGLLLPTMILTSACVAEDPEPPEDPEPGPILCDDVEPAPTSPHPEAGVAKLVLVPPHYWGDPPLPVMRFDGPTAVRAAARGGCRLALAPGHYTVTTDYEGLSRTVELDLTDAMFALALVLPEAEGPAPKLIPLSDEAAPVGSFQLTLVNVAADIDRDATIDLTLHAQVDEEADGTLFASGLAYGDAAQGFVPNETGAVAIGIDGDPPGSRGWQAIPYPAVDCPGLHLIQMIECTGQEVPPGSPCADVDGGGWGIGFDENTCW
jgi:hypothetical protein